MLVSYQATDFGAHTPTEFFGSGAITPIRVAWDEGATSGRGASLNPKEPILQFFSALSVVICPC